MSSGEGKIFFLIHQTSRQIEITNFSPSQASYVICKQLGGTSYFCNNISASQIQLPPVPNNTPPWTGLQGGVE